MHEVSLCESIIKIIEKQAEKEKFAHVLRVQLTVGELSGASPESLAFAFPLVAKGTVAEGADLAFTHTAGNELRVSAIEVGS